MFKSMLASSLLLMSTVTLGGELKISGEPIQGGLIVGKATMGSTVTLNGKPLKVSKEGLFSFGFGRDDKEEVNLAVVFPDGKSENRRFMPKVREYKIQRVNGIAKKIMNPDPEAIARSKKDSKQVRETRSKDLDLTEFAKGFVPPIDGIVTGVYGSQRIYNGVPKTPHFGIDYAGKTGDPVKAPASGVVTMYVPDMFYSGGTMIIDHGHGISSTFLHLSKSYVKTGDFVEKGQLVAAVGSSGRSTGPHLDWRINWFNVRLDPAIALTLEPLAD